MHSTAASVRAAIQISVGFLSNWSVTLPNGRSKRKPSGPVHHAQQRVDQVRVGGGVLVVARVEVLPEHLDGAAREVRPLVDRVDERQAVVDVPEAQREAGRPGSGASSRRCTRRSVVATTAGSRTPTGIVDSRVNPGSEQCLRMPETTATERDARHLHAGASSSPRAARGQTSPNPLVGAVVVKDGRVIGEGITQPPGEQHAEAMALEAAAEEHRRAPRCTCRSSRAATRAARRRAPTRSSRPGSRAW